MYFFEFFFLNSYLIVVTIRKLMQRSIFSNARYFLRFNMCSTIRNISEKKMSQDAIYIFQSAYKAVQPPVLMNNSISVHKNNIEVCGKVFPLDRNIHIVGFGKAVLGMAAVLDDKLKGRNVSGILSIPKVSLKLNHYRFNSNIQVFEGAHNNIPDDDALYAANKIKELVSSLTEHNLLIVLISGGGSALLPAPKPPLTLDEKKNLISLLFSKGATIEEINSVRKRLSSLKGGNLAELAKPATVISLILSDIIGDPIGMIASGPTVQNTDDPKLPISIIEKYNLRDNVPNLAIQFIEDTQNKPITQVDFLHVTNFIIGNNKIALDAAAETAKKLNFYSIIITKELNGTARCVGKNLISTVVAGLERNVDAFNQNFARLHLESDSKQTLLDSLIEAHTHGKKLCLLFGGETTVEVSGSGIGGRNQELALAAAIELHEMKPNKDVVLLSAGTDGIDGPTPAAGAIATSLVVDIAEKQGLDPYSYLENNDSYTFFSKVNNGKGLIQTGHTGTNVMDIVVILIN